MYTGSVTPLSIRGLHFIQDRSRTLMKLALDLTDIPHVFVQKDLFLQMVNSGY